MKIDDIKEQIMEEISNEMSPWYNILDETQPGHYGCKDLEPYPESLYVDIPNGSFSGNGEFSATLILGASQGETSHEWRYSKPFKIKGKFDFVSSQKVKINNSSLEIDIDLDVFG